MLNKERSNMGMQSAVRSSSPPRSSWRYRVPRYHVPMALASGLVLVLFMALSPFATQAHSQLDMQSDGPLPQPGSHQAGVMDHGPRPASAGGLTPPAAMDHGPGRHSPTH
jgi:hypothetical protein